MNPDSLRKNLQAFLHFTPPDGEVFYEILKKQKERGYTRYLISYTGDENEKIPAYLLIPYGEGPFPAVLALHQHHRQWNLGKSEICGLAGDPWQAFGPALARRGFVVLAPDSICFEDRRFNKKGIEPDPEDGADWLQHYNQMAYRLLRGGLLMRKVLDDSTRAFNLLYHHDLVSNTQIGLLGHSYGGNTVLFYAALDTRASFACSSGAACSFRHKLANQTGIEMAEIIPGFARQYDIEDLIKCVAPRQLLVISAREDKYSKDAAQIVNAAGEAYAHYGCLEHLEHQEYEGGHALTEERFHFIVDWLSSRNTTASKLFSRDKTGG